MEEARSSRRVAVGLVLGPALFALLLAAGPPAGMSPAAHRTAALAVWMACWWLAVPVPLEATALLPIAILPLLGVAGIERAAAPYANSVIFLFLGGFFLAAAMERWGLHRRVAFGILAMVGTDAARVVLAFMIATAFISMWISNTASAVMMMPMATAVIALRREGGAAGEPRAQAAGGRRPAADGLGPALVLGVAYAASIGGMATLIGTPPNTIFAGAVRQLLHRDFGFGTWMRTGVPLMLVMLPACWLLLTRLFRTRGEIAGLAARVREEHAALGPLAGAERWTLWVFLLAVAAWLLREPKDLGAFTIPGIARWAPAVSDAGIAIAAALLLFTVPLSLRERRFALDWPTARRAPWGILLVFGGGLSLADAFQASGLATWIGGLLGNLEGRSTIVIVLVVAVVFVALSELASNTAVAAMGMPLLAGLAPAVGLPPILLMQVAALAASVSFLLPVSTPPNAVAFATGEVTVAQMVRAGIGMDVISILVITAAAVWLM